MSPDFDEHGNLRPGLHRCTLEELIARFGQGSAEREVEAKELVGFVSWAKEIGIVRIIVDGSYVTATRTPNDVDVVVLPGPGCDQERLKVLYSSEPWPFIHILIATDEADLERWVTRDFASDREENLRGIVEIEL